MIAGLPQGPAAHLPHLPIIEAPPPPAPLLPHMRHCQAPSHTQTLAVGMRDKTWLSQQQKAVIRHSSTWQDLAAHVHVVTGTSAVQLFAAMLSGHAGDIVDMSCEALQEARAFADDPLAHSWPHQ